MSDRIAVFNAGRIEQVGAPAEVYERPATRFVAGFVGTSNLLGGDAAEAITRAAQARSPSGPRRSGSRTPVADGRSRRVRRPGPDPRASSTSARHPLPRRARRRRRARGHPAEPDDDLDRGPRAAGARCPPRLETAAHPGDRRVERSARSTRRSTAMRRFLTWRHGRTGRRAPARSTPTPGGRVGRGAPSSAARRLRRSESAAAPPCAARRRRCSPGDTARSSRSSRPSTCRTVGGPGEGALNLIIWAGYAESGENVPEYDWVTPFEQATGCKVNVEGRRHVRPDGHAHAPGRRTPTTASRRRATPPCA